MTNRPARYEALHTDRLTLRPVRKTDISDLRQIRGSEEVARWWGPPEPNWPLDDDETVIYTIVHEEDIIGIIQWSEEADPMYRHAGIDLFLGAPWHRRGLGQEAIRAVRDYLIKVRGHHRITIDPAAENTHAVHCYEQCGFNRVGVMHGYEKNFGGSGWHDGLLMEFVIDNPGG